MGSILCGCFGGDCRNESKDDTDGGKGKPIDYDADFRGPIRGKSRRPKDLLCLIIFIVFCIFMGAIAIFAWVNGEPLRIIYPTDSKGRLCGVDPAVQDKPFLMFFDLTKCVQVVTINELVTGDVSASTLFTCPTPQVCVSECPTANEFGVRDNPVCVDSVDTSRFVNVTNAVSFTAADNIATLLQLISEEKCAPYYITSTQIARRCIPTFVNIQDQFEEVFNFNTTEDIQNAANSVPASGFGDLVLNLTVQDLVDGTFTQELLINSRQFLLDVYQDLVVVWPALIIGVVVALVLSFTYICLLRWIAGVIIGIGIALCFVLIFAIAVFCYYQFYCFQDAASLFGDLQNAISNNVNLTLVEFINTTQVVGFSAQICAATSPLRELIDTQLPWFQYQEYTWLGVGIVATLLFLILFILLIALIKKIRISVAIIKESSKAVGGVPTSVFFPALTWVLLIALFIYWGVVAVFLVTASDPTYVVVMNGSLPESSRNLSGVGLDGIIVTNGTPCMTTEFTDIIYALDATGTNVSISCLFDQFVTSNFLLGIQIYHLFGLFWIGNFILALGEVTLAGAFASWYWAFRKPKDVPTFALIQSFGRALLFHTGSIAFGALIIALVQLARVILGYIQKKLKGKTGKVAQALLCMLQCCLWCFEKILRYINRQAYIEIAIYGYDFCTGACKAVKLLLRNVLTTAVKDRIVAFLLFLGKLAITAAVGVLAYLGFGGYLGLGETLWNQPLNYYLIPVIFLVIITYFIASGFMSVYHMAVDTIFICAMEDLERNNGKDKPYFMSKKLMKLLNAKNVGRHGTDGTDGSVEMESLETVNA